jgi:hypothetical protein
MSTLHLPEDMLLYVSTQTLPACHGEFVGFDILGESPL